MRSHIFLKAKYKIKYNIYFTRKKNQCKVAKWVFFVFQGEIDAHEDSFRATDEAGQALLNTGHYASEEVKEKVGLWKHSDYTFFLLCDITLIYTSTLPCFNI